jgi:hypothetical protein
MNSTRGLFTVQNTGTSTNGTLASFVASTTLNTGLFVLNNGNVGIGTSSPSNNLTINQTTNGGGLLLSGSLNPRVIVSAQNNTNSEINLITNATGTTPNYAAIYNNGADGSLRFFVNGPTTPEADEIFEKNGVTVIPDILANSGGVATSYFEWYQNMNNQAWSKEQVLEKLKDLMVKAFAGVLEKKNKYNTTFRNAAYIVAAQRIMEKMY